MESPSKIAVEMGQAAIDGLKTGMEHPLQPGQSITFLVPNTFWPWDCEPHIVTVSYDDIQSLKQIARDAIATLKATEIKP